jgi:L-aminopeptidase/D-esterase-like protein
MSAGNITADLDMIGTLAAQVMSEAITRAVMSAESAYGLKAARFLNE